MYQFFLLILFFKPPQNLNRWKYFLRSPTFAKLLKILFQALSNHFFTLIEILVLILLAVLFAEFFETFIFSKNLKIRGKTEIQIKLSSEIFSSLIWLYKVFNLVKFSVQKEVIIRSISSEGIVNFFVFHWWKWNIIPFLTFLKELFSNRTNILTNSLVTNDTHLWIKLNFEIFSFF